MGEKRKRVKEKGWGTARQLSREMEEGREDAGASLHSVCSLVGLIQMVEHLRTDRSKIRSENVFINDKDKTVYKQERTGEDFLGSNLQVRVSTTPSEVNSCCSVFLS